MTKYFQEMLIMKELLQDLQDVIKTAINRWHFIRYQRNGGNIDQNPF